MKSRAPKSTSSSKRVFATKSATPPGDSFPVVAIGASAGGLEGHYDFVQSYYPSAISRDTLGKSLKSRYPAKTTSMKRADPSRPTRLVGSKDFERVAHDLEALFSVPDQVLNLARKELNDGRCVTINFDGSRAELVRIGFLEV